jgi:protein-S-isoprenylcysteine O-methyltransferase Ste14
MITLMNMSAVNEERLCLEKYGDAYRDYMNRTPRWIGIPKSQEKE